MSNAIAGPSGSKAPPPTTFEFTKRKHWADLLITELAEAIILILGPVGQIWYCGAAVYELLGWRSDELIDSNLADLVNIHDQHALRGTLDRSVRMRAELTCYARFKCKIRSWLGDGSFDSQLSEKLFEFKGYPHFISGDDCCKCFFVVAKPCPSRNTALLNTFLELKMDNIKLQQRVKDLRAISDAAPVPVDLGYPLSYPPPSWPPCTTLEDFLSTAPSFPQPAAITSGNYFYPMPLMYDDLRATAPARTPSMNAAPDCDAAADGPRKKKLKKSHGQEQYVCVTCGRTDSPEWRKGPTGPKTLCNACGLRWAKQARKVDVRTEEPNGSRSGNGNGNGHGNGHGEGGEIGAALRLF